MNREPAGGHPREAISALLDDRLDPIERRAVEAHLADCAGCRRTRDDLLTLRAAAAAETPPEMPGDLTRRIVARLDDRDARAPAPVAGPPAVRLPAGRFPWTLRAWLRPMPLAAAAGLVLAAALFLLAPPRLVTTGGSDRPSPTSAAPESSVGGPQSATGPEAQRSAPAPSQGAANRFSPQPPAGAGGTIAAAPAASARSAMAHPPEPRMKRAASSPANTPPAGTAPGPDVIGAEPATVAGRQALETRGDQPAAGDPESKDGLQAPRAAVPGGGAAGAGAAGASAPATTGASAAPPPAAARVRLDALRKEAGPVWPLEIDARPYRVSLLSEDRMIVRAGNWVCIAPIEPADGRRLASLAWSDAAPAEAESSRADSPRAQAGAPPSFEEGSAPGARPKVAAASPAANATLALIRGRYHAALQERCGPLPY